MGEIGRDRREYLYEMTYCEILLIRRGYRKRNVLQYQLQRLQAFGSFHCMSGSKKEPQEWLPMYFDRYRENIERRIPDKDEVSEMLAEMAAINSKGDDGLEALANDERERSDETTATDEAESDGKPETEE